MHDTPRVSVIIPTHNRAGLLPRAVESVLAQTHDDYELIIVDDCSSDDTQRVIAEFADSRIRHFRHEVNRGVSAARNTGIANARGEYIAFLDDDDEWLPTRLAKQSAIMDTAPSRVGFVYGWMDVVYPDSGGIPVPFDRLNAEGNIFSHMIRLRGCLHSTFLARTSSVRDVGGFDENMVAREDSEFLCRLSQKWEAMVLPEVVSVYRRDHGHTQLTRMDRQRRAAINIEFLNRHIALYESELRKSPEGFAHVLRRLAIDMKNQGNVIGSAFAFLRAFRVAPGDTCRALFSNIRYVFLLFMKRSPGVK